MDIVCVIALLSLFQTSSAFLPNHLSSEYLNDDDYTLTDVTRRGILLAVADYFQNNSLDGKELPSLPDLDPLTPTTLYDAYYGDGVSAAKFERAIEQIVLSNVDVSRLQRDVAKWHFNGEQITQGNQLMIRMRDTILSILESPTPNYDSARDYVGQYLHLLQCFYANTDWIELWHFIYNWEYPDEPYAPIYEDLGRRDKPFFPVAPGDIPTCRNCYYDGSLDCSYNIWDARRGEYLTSGYKSGQDIVKPRVSESDIYGKCSHGGPYDASRDIVAIGGINKDGSDPRLAPHYYHHFEAAELAIQATREFLHSSDYSIFKNLTSLGSKLQDERFRNLFNLGTGSTLAFVIDDTGSMGDEIAAVKAEAIQIVLETNGTTDAPYNYVVVPFNDPEVGPLLVTEDPDECVDFIGSLYPHGGGDCPELCNTGLEIAVSNSLPGSQIYVFTDASEKDSEKTEAVLALLQSKECRVDYILTGDCALKMEKSPNQQHPGPAYEINLDQSPDLQRIHPSASAAYSMIAKGSGGGVYATDKSNIGDITEIIKVGLGSSKIQLAKWTWDGSTSENTTYVDFFIDSMVTEFSVIVTGESNAPVLELIKPSGEPVSSNDTNIEIVVNVDLVLAISATNPMVGEWQIWIKNPEFKYEFDITGQSIVDFTYQFMAADESEVMFPIDGAPIAGVPTTISINVIGMEHVSNAEVVKLTPIAGEGSLYPLSPAGGRDSHVFLGVVVPPSDPFTVAIEGQDQDGNVFVRLAPTLVSAQSFKLDFLPSDGEELNPGGSKHIPFSLHNEGINDTFTLRAETDDKLQVSVVIQPENVFIIKGKAVVGNISLVAESAQAGTISIITVFAYSSSGKVTSVVTSQYIAEPDQQIPDSTNPICKFDNGTEFTECTVDMMNPTTCHLHLWSIILEARDDDSGIYALDAFPEVTTAEFNIDFNNGSVAFGSYSADCCCPLVTITIRDYIGNVGQCSIDYYAPVSDIAPTPACLPQPPLPPSTRPPTPPSTRPPTTLQSETKEPAQDGLSVAAIIGISCGAFILLISVGVSICVTCKESAKSNKKINKQQYDERKFSDLVYENTSSPMHSNVIN